MTPSSDDWDDEDFELDPAFFDEDGAPVARDYEGAEVLGAGAPSRVLERLLDGDPLGIEERVRERHREEGWFLDPSALVLRALARTAYAAYDYRGKPQLDLWLKARIERAARDLVEEQLGEEYRHVSVEDSVHAALYEGLSRGLGIPLARCRLVCAIVNRLEAPTRRVLRAVALEGADLRELSVASGDPLEVLQRRLTEALRAIYGGMGSDTSPDDEGGGWT